MHAAEAAMPAAATIFMNLLPARCDKDAKGRFRKEKPMKPSIKYIVAGYVALIAVNMFAGNASAGTLPDGNGGAVCKGAGSCLVLQLDCKGTYTDATDKNGTVYGKCSQVAKIGGAAKPKALKSN
jgi:hypothetical protein